MIRNLLQIKYAHSLFRQSFSQTAIYLNSHRTVATNDKISAQAVTEEVSKKITNPFNINEPKVSFTKIDEDDEVEDGEEIDDEERSKRLKVLQLEADILHQEGRRVPQLNFFQDQHWDHLLTLKTKSARGKYYGYLWQIEMKKQSKEVKKEERAIAVQERKVELRKEREENTHIIYGLGHTALFLRFYDSTINHWQNNRLTRAMQFGSKIVLDCSYDNYMTKREALNAAKQLCLCFAENRAHDDPFDLHYCNVDMNTFCMQHLERFVPTMHNPEFPMNVHSKCFTEMFPKENLVYLTPHCRTDLTEYNHDDVYIVGAMVDTVNNEPLSLAKAKKLGLRMARLPLDRYLQWGSGSGKSLTLNQMVNIMLDLKLTGDWEKSLKHVPQRKIFNMEREEFRGNRSLKHRAGKLNVQINQILSDDDDDYSDRRRATFRSQNEKQKPFKSDASNPFKNQYKLR